VPFALLPKAAGEIAWRLVSISIFAISIRSMTRLIAERTGKDLFPLMSLVAIFVGWDCARNGQATLLMTAFMLLAVDDIARSRLWTATLWLCLSVAIKPLSIVLVLLVIAIDRPMSWRLVVGMLLTALAPFLVQHPSYVIEQYRACIENMRTAAHMGVVAHGWTTPFTALRVFGLDVPEKVQTVIRLAAALGTLGLCFSARKRYDPARSAVFVYSLAALYLILFSPRTENNTYAMLGPVAGYVLADAVARKRYAEAGALAVLTFVMVGSRPFERMLAPGAEPIWLSPLMATVLAGYVLFRLLNGKPQINTGEHR